MYIIFLFDLRLTSWPHEKKKKKKSMTTPTLQQTSDDSTLENILLSAMEARKCDGLLASHPLEKDQKQLIQHVLLLSSYITE